MDSDDNPNAIVQRLHQQGHAKLGDIVYVDDTGGFFVLTRWSPRWCFAKLHIYFLDVVEWFRGWPLWWEHNKVAFLHGAESPGCMQTNLRCVERRFDEARGFHYYCVVCSRPVGKSLL